MLFVFPPEHNSNCFFISAMKSMKVKMKLRILPSYFPKLKVSCLYKILHVKILTISLHSKYKLNIFNNARYVIKYIYIYIFVFTKSPLQFRHVLHHSQGELRIPCSKLYPIYKVTIFIGSQSVKYIICKLYKVT